MRKEEEEADAYADNVDANDDNDDGGGGPCEHAAPRFLNYVQLIALLYFRIWSVF